MKQMFVFVICVLVCVLESQASILSDETTHGITSVVITEECFADDSGVLDIAGRGVGKGDTIIITIRIQNSPNPVDDIGFDVIYNPEVFTYIGFDRGELVEKFKYFEAHENTGGLVRCGGFGNVGGELELIPAGASGNLVYLTFKVSENALLPTKLELNNLKDDIKEWTVSHGCIGRCSGDINGDGELTPRDARAAFEKFLEICPTSIDVLCEDICCDVNQDGDCTPKDALCIFNRFLEKPGCLD